MGLLAASGGDTMKLFDVSGEPGDPCILSYTPSPGCLVNSVKWNHTSESLALYFGLKCISFMVLMSCLLGLMNGLACLQVESAFSCFMNF